MDRSARHQDGIDDAPLRGHGEQATREAGSAQTPLRPVVNRTAAQTLVAVAIAPMAVVTL